MPNLAGTARDVTAREDAAAAQATADAAVPKALYDANTILAATADNTPAPLTVGPLTLVGRKSSGAIAALAGPDARTIVEGNPYIAVPALPNAFDDEFDSGSADL